MANMRSNGTMTARPSEPSCTLFPQPPLLPPISDKHLAIILPTVIYIVSSTFFHFLDSYNILSSYRIHPSEEVLKRNHVTRWQCLKQVFGYHVMQIAIGIGLSRGAVPTMIGDEACRIHAWANSIRTMKSYLPTLLQALGVDSTRLVGATTDVYFPGQSFGSGAQITALDTVLAKAVFYIGIPALQFFAALAVVDTWIYFTHRLCHVNKTLYRRVHARHHLLYVSYAYGAVYAHPFESLFLDILSFIFANGVARFTERQSMVFGSLAVIKTISDHCGYVFPFDPFLALNSNGANFHDLHHQSWGLKNNFSTYTTFWDNLCGTTWSDKEGARKRYEKAWSAQRKGKSDERVDSMSVQGKDGGMKTE